MRIGIDARLLGLEHAGLGRYVKKLVDELIKQDKKNQYVLFLNNNHISEYEGIKNVEVVELNVSIYGLLEQIICPIIFNSHKLDLLHIPHFNAPVLYFGKTILTIHDLIKHYSTGKDTTTKNPFLYSFKRLGYLLLTQIVIRKAKHILVPSKWVKEDIIQKFRVNPSKITVTYEAVDDQIRKISLNTDERKKILHKYKINQPFIIYTGSVYPHKNVGTLIESIITYNQQRQTTLNLAIVCARSVFYDRIKNFIQEKNAESQIKLLGFVSDEDVSKLYSLALALVHPSLMEGFGLTGLEAMKVGLPVISSDATCLPEIYGDAAIYFDPHNNNELVDKLIKIVGDSDLRKELSIRGELRSKRYSWYKMGKETKAVYRQLLEK